MKKIMTILFVAICIFVLTGCDKKNPIVGKWAHDSYIYTFNKDNTCEYDAAGTIMECTYEIEDDTISILYKGYTAPFKTTFKIEKDTLHIIDSLGSDTEYKRK